MGIKSVALLMALVLAVAVAGISCGAEEEREKISTEVATEWSQDSIDTVSEVVVELLSWRHQP